MRHISPGARREAARRIAARRRRRVPFVLTINAAPLLAALGQVQTALRAMMPVGER